MTERSRRPAGISRWRTVAAVATALALVSSVAAAEPPACVASAEIVPADAFVGQQLVYRLEILTREEERS